MKQKNYLLTIGCIFAIIALVHALRLVGGWEVVFNNFAMPGWASWFGVVVAGFLSYQAFRLARRA